MSPLAPAELLVSLDRSARTALRWQLAQRIREAIREGRLPAGGRLPSTRALAEQLGVSRGVVVDAYDQLEAEGYLTARRGVPPTVRAGPAAAASEQAAGPRQGVAHYDLTAVAPDLSLFPRSDWLRALRAELGSMPNRSFGYGDPLGVPELRRCVAEYLGRVRGVVVPWKRLLVVSGFTQGLYITCRVLRARGARCIAVEDPSLDDQWDAIRRADLDLVGIPVDGHGVQTDGLGNVDAIVVTPAHQFPTGVVLSPERRHALIDWARGGDRFVIEDDFGGEYRYDREPIGSLQGLAPDRVVYLGTASNTLAPALRLGWLAAPVELVEEAAAERWSIDSGSPALEQYAYAHLLESGALDRYLRRTRRIYRARRDALTAALHASIPECRIEGGKAGLHLMVMLPVAVDESAIVAAAAARGVRVRGLQSYHLDDCGSTPGLVVGYGNLPVEAVPSAIRLLAAALRGAETSKGNEAGPGARS